MKNPSLDVAESARPSEQTRYLPNRRWVISKNGTRCLGDCQEHLWEIRAELDGIGGLIRCIDGEAEILSEDLFGLGTWLKRIAQRLQTAERLLGQVLEPAADEDIGQDVKSR